MSAVEFMHVSNILPIILTITGNRFPIAQIHFMEFHITIKQMHCAVFLLNKLSKPINDISNI
jgi:hypothetical protein